MVHPALGSWVSLHLCSGPRDIGLHPGERIGCYIGIYFYILTYFQVHFEVISEKDVSFKRSAEIKIIKEVRNLDGTVLGRM